MTAEWHFSQENIAFRYLNKGMWNKGMWILEPL
jgi:hypothetical protein